MLKPLANAIGARQHPQELARCLESVASYSRNDAGLTQTNCLSGLLDALQKTRPAPLIVPSGLAALRRLLASPSLPVQRLTLQLAGLLQVTDVPEMTAAFANAAREALDGFRSIAERQAALGLLASAPMAVLRPATDKLLEPNQPLDLQLAAVAALAATDHPQVAPALIARWNTYSPRMQTAVLEAVFRNQTRTAALLDALEKGLLPPRSLDSVRRSQLLSLSRPELRDRAKALLEKQSPLPEPFEGLARYQAALQSPRDTQRGRTLFHEHCSRCHSLLGEGGRIGPDLSGTKGRAEETLLLDILQPSDQITAGYRSYLVTTTNGDLFTGVLAAESATSITLPGEDGREQIILRRDIESIPMSDLSLMPENLRDLLQPQDLADLLGYLRKTLAATPPAILTLFDDDPLFANYLFEGDGQAEVLSGDSNSGTAALKVTPPQRFSAKIAGWNYPIVENPGPGQYRYLRFAWKAPSARGVMLELADAGQWPPPDRPLRRYYSGQNTSPWQARQLAEAVPRDWTTVTVDLWRDFGEFTLTGIAPTALGGPAFFDSLQLLR